MGGLKSTFSNCASRVAGISATRRHGHATVTTEAPLALHVLVQRLVNTASGGRCLGLGVTDRGLGQFGDLTGGGRRVKGERSGGGRLAVALLVLDFRPLALVRVLFGRGRAHPGVVAE